MGKGYPFLLVPILVILFFSQLLIIFYYLVEVPDNHFAGQTFNTYVSSIS